MNKLHCDICDGIVTGLPRRGEVIELRHEYKPELFQYLIVTRTKHGGPDDVCINCIIEALRHGAVVNPAAEDKR